MKQKIAKKVCFLEFSDKHMQKCLSEALILLGFQRGTVEMEVPRCRGLTQYYYTYQKTKPFLCRNGSSPMKGIDTLLLLVRLLPFEGPVEMEVPRCRELTQIGKTICNLFRITVEMEVPR